MKFTFNPKHNIAYIRLADAPRQVETLRISNELNIDMTADGRVYGFELLNASEQLQGFTSGQLVVQNSETGQTVNVALP
jgi:uncharacterized protein YuzE